ncbi:pyrroline-5-carboxylate reductase [Grosmannia clavigera kw1407]|uniref:Pyrroline-5-carboxylate reductase n=1 Tax=Grosmannia clavigera (strain kw1407 / UAMH 11150) TaxID=655863 RepID=F0XJV0_GROCL|nr:pyrroline-5-carboxylate reductase [Grosmannia clavigera kw1407]EFX02342.1 pyrroline-5-carboxylate reductase [Grosmannia clavigera kw1407]
MAALQSAKLSFIGGGNMAGAIIGGLLARGIAAEQICVAEPWDVNRAKMAALGVRTTTSNAEAAAGADLVVISVKPQVAQTACREVAASWTADGTRPTATTTPVILSIAAGVTLASLRQWTTTKDGRVPHVVRVMPNTPALVGEGASGLFAGDDLTAAEKTLATELLQSVSKAAEWVDREELLDVVTGLSGSGPAYFFAMVEHLVTAATKLGLPLDQASRLAKQTCLGAGAMLVQSADSPGQLRKNVTSPNGTTHAALVSFEQSGFEAMVDKAVVAATERATELGKS